MGRKVGITDVVLRDAHQSLLATRMRTEHMLPIAEKLDRVGYWSVEMWGGATFDTCLRYLKEDPWERLRALKAAMPHTRMQMLLRGQNVVGYRNYADDVVEAFVGRAAADGIDVFRVFDALNDIRNMQVAIKAAKKAGAHVEGSFCYTTSPAHSIKTFVDLSKALEALIALVDPAISSLSRGTPPPPTETVVAMLQEPGEPPLLDLLLLAEIADYFRDVRRKYREFEMDYFVVDTNALAYQVPGGMLSNLAKQLKDQNALDRMPAVLLEVPRVRAELGYPPLVTPTSQIVGTQATLNVLLGERYKMIPNETKDLIRGYYGHPAAPIDPEVQRKAIGDEAPIHGRPADQLKPELEKARREATTAKSPEDVLSFALFQQVAKEFFDAREGVGRLPEDLVAALAVALVHASPAEPPKAAGPAPPRWSAWKSTARQEAVRHGRHGG